MEHAVATFDPNSRRNRLDAAFEAKANYVWGSASHKKLMDDLAALARTSGASGPDAELYEAVLRGVHDVEPESGMIRFPFEAGHDVGFGTAGKLSGLTGLGPVRLDLSKHGPHCAVEDDPGKRDYWNHVIVRARDGDVYSVALAHGEQGSVQPGEAHVLDDIALSMDEAEPHARALCEAYLDAARAEPEAARDGIGGPEGPGMER